MMGVGETERGLIWSYWRAGRSRGQVGASWMPPLLGFVSTWVEQGTPAARCCQARTKRCAGLRGLRRPPAHTSRARLPVGLIKHSVLPRVVPRVSHGKDTLKCPTVAGVVCWSPSPGENPQPGARGPPRMASVPDPPQLGWGQRAGEARLERAFNASFIRTHPALSAGPAGGEGRRVPEDSLERLPRLSSFWD